MEDKLLSYCLTNPHNRFWWFRANRHMPPCYAVLSSSDRENMLDFFRRSEAEGGSVGDCNVPCISWLTTFILSNNVRRIVELGHCYGFSTILIAMCLKMKNIENGFVSVDNSVALSRFAQERLESYGLSRHVCLECCDSTHPDLPGRVARHFDREAVDLIFVDSSHEYRATLRELAMWYPLLRPGGFLVLHDCSVKAKAYDPAGRGVQDALYEYMGASEVQDVLLINRMFASTMLKKDLVYQDGCGLAIIQKSLLAEHCAPAARNSNRLD